MFFSKCVLFIGHFQIFFHMQMSTFLAMNEEKSNLAFGCRNEEIEKLLALYYAVRWNRKFPSVLVLVS